MKTTLFAVALLLAIANADVVQHYGYFTVNATYGANMFYWMFESQNNPKTDPLVLWLTGTFFAIEIVLEILLSLCRPIIDDRPTKGQQNLQYNLFVIHTK